MATISAPFRYKHRLLTDDGASKAAAEPSVGPSSALKGVVCTYLELLPFVYLVASARSGGRECVLELVHMPLDGSATRSANLDDAPPVEQAASSAASLPPALRAAFRIPKVIQLEPDDEGFVTTLELLPDWLRPSVGASAAALGSDAASRDAISPLATRTPAAGVVDWSTLHVHLLIGTSNGTVLVANALRGTLLAVAQFQYHHDMLRRRGVGTEEDGAPAVSPGRTESQATGGATNQSVVRFVAQLRSADAAWNPSLLNSIVSGSGAETALSVPSGAYMGDAGTGPRPPSSKTPPAVPVSVYVVHSGGKIVQLERRALDVFVRVCADRLDGRRPHLSLEWVTSTVSTAFPVAGPAIDFAAFVQFVYTTPQPTHYTEAEARTIGVSTADARTLSGSQFPGRLIHDAAFFSASSGASSLIAPLSGNSFDAGGVILCGRFPAFATYLLEQQRTEFSASHAVKAVANAVSGMAKNWLRSALGTTAPPAPLPRLPKRPQRVDAGLLAADTTLTSVLVDPTSQWAAFGYEGGGRIYLVDLVTGAMCRVLKGCRAARFHWTSLTLMGKRLSALVVHLPLRKLVEVHTVRMRGRIAACHVDDGAMLLRPAACSVCVGSTFFTGHALLMNATGDIQYLHFDLTTLERQIRVRQDAQLRQVNAEGGTNGSGSLTPGLLAACRTPDDFFDLALQIPLPDGPFFTASGVRAQPQQGRYDEAVAFAFRLYKRRLGEVCDAVKRRFAPSASEPRTIPVSGSSTPATAQAMRKPLTAAQCLNYLQLRGRLVDSYAKLLTNARPVTNTVVNALERRWAGVVPAPLWSTSLATAQSKTAQKFWASALQAWCTAHAESGGAEWTVLTKIVTSSVRRVEKSHSDTDGSVEGGEDAQLSPGQFLSYFYCGDNKPTFLLSHDSSASLGTSRKTEEVQCYDALSRLFFGGGSAQAFVQCLSDITELGLDINDLACITLTWIYRGCCRHLETFLAHNNLGALAFVLQLFPDAGIVAAVTQVPLQLTGSEVAEHTADGIAGLLLCLVARQGVKTCTAQTVAQSMCLAARQLIGVHQCLCADAFAGAQAGGFTVCLDALLPRTARDCDALDALYLRAGATLESAKALLCPLPRAKVEPGASAVDYLALEDTVYQLIADGPGSPRTAVQTSAVSTITSAPGWHWVAKQQWDGQAFTGAVVDRLRQQWHESEPAGTTTTRLESDRWALFSQCCVLVYALAVVDRVVQPLGDPGLTFWDFNSVPDANFLERVQHNSARPNEAAVDRRWLVGEKATRAYLCSVRDVTLFAQSCARSVFGRHADAMRVVTVIQTIAACLTADDERVFPLVPRTLRQGLRFLMHLSGANAELLSYRLNEVLSLLLLLIFWVDVDKLGAGERELRAVRGLSVPWRDLYGPRDNLFVVFPVVSRLGSRGVSTTTTSTQEDADFTASLASRSAHMSTSSATAASGLARRFVAAFDTSGYDVSGASTIGHDWLDNHVLASGVDRLSAALGLQDIVPGFSRLVVLDAMVKRLCSPDRLASALLAIPDRGLVARVTVRDLGAALACILRYFSQQRKQLAERQQRERFDQVSLRMNGVLMLMSQPCRQWVKSLLPASAEPRKTSAVVEAPPDNGSTASLERAAVGDTATWFGPGEMDSLYERVVRIIQLPEDSPSKKSFFELLFRLAQLSVEGKSRLDRGERRIVDELPTVTEGLCPFLK